MQLNHVKYIEFLFVKSKCMSQCLSMRSTDWPPLFKDFHEADYSHYLASRK